jgi:phosphatidylserine/phosphatidylglycerophosphate/cardiolipin synthase-like enzyme
MLFFPPSDGTNAQIIGTIMSAESSVYFATLVFTRDDIADAVIDRSNDFFVDVSGMIDQVNTTGSEYEYLQENFVNVYDYGTVTSSLHHKYVIVDVDELDEDPMVLTGSHNWSSSAENSNDENTLIIHDPLLVNQFYQEYAQRLSFITNVADQDRNTAISVFPNPTSDILFLQGFDHQQNIHLQVIDLSGRTVLEESICIQAGSIHPVHLQSLPSGTYLIQLSGNEYITSKSFVKY